VNVQQMSAIALASALRSFGVAVSSYAQALEWESADPKHKELVLKNYLLLAGHPVFHSDSTFVPEDSEKCH
jgi:hypothetical protein